MATFKVMLVLALAAAAFAVPMVRRSVLDATVEEAPENSQVCVADGLVYERGAPVPTGSHCELCVCQPPGFACTTVQCEQPVNTTGCRLRAARSACCPQYQCPCQFNGAMYEDGSRIEDPAEPCLVRFCLGGAIRSTPLQCFVRDDCEPRPVAGSCCPSYDHCTALGKFPQGPAEPHPAGEEVTPLVTEAETVATADEEVKATAEDNAAVEADEDEKAVEEEPEVEVEEPEVEVEEPEVEVEEPEVEAEEPEAEEPEVEEPEVEVEESEVEAEEPEVEAEEPEVQVEEGSGLLADEGDAVEASGAEAIELGLAADDAFAAALQIETDVLEGSGAVLASDDADAEGSGLVADFARSAALQVAIEASGELAQDEAEAVEGSGDATVFDGAASEPLLLAVESSGDVVFDAEAVEGSGRLIFDAEASEALQLAVAAEGSGDVAQDQAEGSGAVESEVGFEGEDLLTSK